MELISLCDPRSGATARILPGLGFNCFGFCAVHEGQPLDVIWSAEGFASGTERPSGSGIPILFPFPGRIQGTTFSWQGRDFPLEEGDGSGNAIHGFALNRPWRVIDKSESSLTGQFQASVDDPSILARWPADFRITATYSLEENKLIGLYLLENPGTTPLPFGFGTHPYFCLPLGENGSADDCLIRVPVSRRWELAGMNATGNVFDVPRQREFNSGLPFSQTRFDDVFTGLDVQSGKVEASITAPQSGPRVVMEFDSCFRECVVYNPPHRQAICIEPYTCVPDAFRLHRQGIDAGLRILNPGESLAARVVIRVE